MEVRSCCWPKAASAMLNAWSMLSRTWTTRSIDSSNVPTRLHHPKYLYLPQPSSYFPQAASGWRSRSVFPQEISKGVSNHTNNITQSEANGSYIIYQNKQAGGTSSQRTLLFNSLFVTTNLQASLTADMLRIWEGLTKPQGLQGARMEEYFDMEFVGLPHN